MKKILFLIRDLCYCSLKSHTVSGKTARNYILTRFAVRFGQRALASISQEEVLEFLLSLTKSNNQATKRNRYSVLASFCNFSINTGLPSLINPCNASVIKKIFKRPAAIQWNIVEKELVAEIIFRTTNTRNRLMLELMTRGGMRVGEVLNLTPADIKETSLAIQNPKSGRTGETDYVPRKIPARLTDYVKANDIGKNDRIFPISYVAARSMVRKAGRLVDIELRPHDLRRHAATYALTQI